MLGIPIVLFAFIGLTPTLYILAALAVVIVSNYRRRPKGADHAVD